MNCKPSQISKYNPLHKHFMGGGNCILTNNLQKYSTPDCTHRSQALLCILFSTNPKIFLMKKYLQILTIIIVIITLCSCEKIVQFPNHKEDNERYDFVENGVNFGKGIAIIGDWDGDRTTPATTLYWAPVNCGYENTGDINTDSDHRLGKLYQWGTGDSSLLYLYDGELVVARSMYYDTAIPSPWYGDYVIVGTPSDKWNNNQGPCPEGWRLPTTHEFSVLCKNRTWLSTGTYACEANAYPGYEFFGEDEHKIPGTGVFFPASGYRRYHDGSAFRRGFDGLYWSSIPDPSYSRSAYYLNFSPSFLFSQSYGSRADCLSVRCVIE